MTTSLYIALGNGLPARQLSTGLSGDERFDVVGCSNDAMIMERDLDCLERVPGIILLSSELYGAQLSELIERLIRTHRACVVVLGLPGDTDEILDSALNSGAVHVERLPLDRVGGLEPNAEQRIARLLLLLAEATCQMPPVESIGRVGAGAAQAPAVPTAASYRCIGIASSTGGLHALRRILGAIPVAFPVPLVVIQHLRSGTDDDFAATLAQQSSLTIELLAGTRRLSPGSLYVAPSWAHTILDERGRLAVSSAPLDSPYVPSADVFFDSMAQIYGPRCIGVVLTGMGEDGAAGLLSIRAAGGRTIAQDRATSQVFGMPRAAIERRAAERILPLDAIGPEIVRLVRILHPAPSTG